MTTTATPPTISEARRFLTTLWGEKPEGWIHVFTIHPRGQKRSYFFASTEEAAAFVDLQITIGSTLATYTGVGSRRVKLGGNERGKAEDIRALAALGADVDVAGPAHAKANLPPDRETALRILDQVPRRPTVIVDTGHGIQAWWILTEPLTIDSEAERRTIAGLATRWVSFVSGFYERAGYDPLDQVGDLPRVLRVPGTINQKKDCPPVPVHVLVEDGPRYADLSDFDLGHPLEDEPRVGGSPQEPGDFPLANLDLIEAGCRWMAHCKEDCATLPEPEWYAALSIIGRCVDGERLAHDWSTGYPGYSREETAAKLKHAVESSAPRTCRGIQTIAGTSWCAECPLQRMTRSPISIGMVDDHGAASPSASAPAPIAVSWPAPLGDAAYHGLAGEIVRAIEPDTEADPAAIMIQVLVAFGSFVGRLKPGSTLDDGAPFYLVERDAHYANLYAVLVGETSKARKGTSLGRVLDVFRRLAIPPPSNKPEMDKWSKDCVTGGLSSGEGLIWQIRDPITKMERPKGKKSDAPEEVTVDPGVDDKRLLVTEPEFGRVLRTFQRDGCTLPQIFRDAWDRGTLRSLVKNSPGRATGAHVSIIGHITADELRRSLDEVEVASGTANRILFCCVRRSKCLPEGGSEGEEEVLAMLAEKLGDAALKARSFNRVFRDEETRAAWAVVYPTLSEGQPGLFGAVTGRAEAQVVRLSLVYALLDGSSTVRLPHLMAALEVWRYCADSARFVFGDSLGNPLADTILQALRKAPDGLSKTEIATLFARNKKAEEIDQALGLLLKHGRATFQRVGTDGRPKEVWRAVQ